MTQATNKTERFADFINKMSFSEVIAFFNFMMEDMMQIENHAMFDYTIQKDAEHILICIGINNFLKVVNSNTLNERAVMCSASQNGELNYEYGFNPWTEILDGYSDWIISHIEDCLNGEKDGSSIKVKYPDLFDVVRESKKKFKFAIHCVLTKVVEVEDYDIGSAEMKLEEQISVDAPVSFDGPGEYSLERLHD